jgi:hypothetical protein
LDHGRDACCDDVRDYLIPPFLGHLVESSTDSAHDRLT